ncbi:AAA family ATPase, partial [Thalassotalea sp. G20_0]|nr:AAA family ATPase [Thalassotalea sp. G20_0]
MCRKAENRSVGAVSAGIGDQARVWKISIDGTGHSQTRDYCLKNGEMRIGWGHVGDLSQDDRSDDEIQAFDSEGSNNQNTLMAFAEDAQVGDLVLCISSRTSVQAVGVIESDYSYVDSSEPCGEGYNHRRSVNWLVQDVDIPFMDLNGGKGFTLKTFYELWRLSPAKVLKRLEEDGHHIFEKEITYSASQEPVVLIIDEINRGNISKVFGELITLLEPSKRAGQSEELSVCLPYSQERLSVPDNLYIIGTMNTADRSLAMMDTALRRRFDFIEMMPDYRLLSETVVSGLNIGQMLEVMNRRIEFLYDREHMLGHAFFMPLNDATGDDERLEILASIFSNKIIPLLEEYF